MKKRLTVLLLLICFLVNLVGQGSLAIAKGEIVARSFALSENNPDTGSEPTETIVAGDDKTYEVQVKYGKDSGIPMSDTALAVKEILPDDKKYEEYIEESAARLKKSAKELQFSRVFDIRITDAKKTDIVYEPAGNVKVTIRLFGEKLDEYDNVDVLHFKDTGRKSGLTVENVKSVAEGETLEFTTDGFSVYVVVGHENGTVNTPRVKFHFIAPEASEEFTGDTYYYAGTPYSFTNVHSDVQTSQILTDGESLEFIADPANQWTKYFYGWYVVTPYVVSGTTDEYGVGTADGALYYTWPAAPEKITFEAPITIEESDIQIGDTVHWSLNGVSGEGTVDADGNVHVFLAPVFENYNFVDFLLYPRDAAGEGSASNLMTRKLVALGSSQQVDVKISDIRSTSTDPVHLVFTGWEYNAGTADNPNWIQCQTVDYTGAEMKDPGKDGVYLDVTADDTTSIVLYPIFIQARWVDYSSGVSGGGASYVASSFRESWGTPGNPPAGMVADDEKNVFLTMETSVRTGYGFEGWYAFAVTDPRTGDITNLSEPADVTFSYIDYNDNMAVKTVTINTTAIKITNADGSIAYSGTCTLTGDNNGGATLGGGTTALFGTVDGALRLYNGIDRLKLYANWTPDASRVTVVYWTENEQDKNYVAPAPGHEKDDYSISAVKLVTTAELNAQSGVIGATFSSGSTLTLEQLKLFTDDGNPILEREFLDDVGAVDAGQEKFYDRNETLSDSSVVINGDGSTTINVYFERKTFKLVFHIGRDGYVKQNGQQRPEFMDPSKHPEYADWDGNWIQFMFNDNKVTSAPPGGLGYLAGPTASSYHASFTMTYMPDDDPDHNQVYSSDYVTDAAKVLGDYVPSDGEDVYVITAKYGAYIGDRWPTPVNPKFVFTNNSTKSMYIWAAYYGSYYCGLSHARTDNDGNNGSNPDINGIYEYMSAELCSSRDGSRIINENQVHHLVAFYGPTNNSGKTKHYHSYYEAIPGTYPDGTVIVDGSDFSGMGQTTWSTKNGDWSAVNGHSFYKAEDADVISNQDPVYQLGTDRDGYELVYSCWQTPQTNDHHIYFFYRQKQYTLTFNFGDTTKQDTYSYTQPLAEADKYSDLVTIPEGYYFKGWYPNPEGIGAPFDFANETMPNDNIVLYPILRVLQYTVKIDPNGAVIDRAVNQSQSTYFTADYGTTVGEYSLKREYIRLTEKELDPDNANYYTGTKYYYINTQRLEVPSEGEWGLPAELRNAVYVTAEQLDAYYNTYSDTIDEILADPELAAYWEGIEKLTKQEFIDTYTSYPYRPVQGSEHYTFMGWFQVIDGSVSSMPYNFNDPVSGPLELRAIWRLDGGYYIQYNPYFIADDGEGTLSIIVGEIEQWTDPEQPTLQLYADQSMTNILHAPTNSTAGWIFRGWRVVKTDGTITMVDGEDYPNWVPTQFDDDNNPVYYQPGDSFKVDAELVSGQGGAGAVIHMQAYYEKENASYRRPKVTNLKLDANGGYLAKADGTALTENTNLDWDEPGTLLMDVEESQISFGDFQSNVAIHLSCFAKQPKYFKHINNYFLLGFDDESDENDFIATYPADSVISVQRTDDETLYAVWEPMVYVTFVNTTDSDITISLTGTGSSTISIVNMVTGEFDRERAADTDTIVVPAKTGDVNGMIKVVFPGAVPGTDSVIATVVNDHMRKKMSVAGEFGETSPYGTGCEDKLFGEEVTYTGVLQTDATGIVVTYTECLENQVVFDVNGGTWTETSEDYFEIEAGHLYGIKEDSISDNQYRPADPTRTNSNNETEKVFLGWTTYADLAAITDFSGASPITIGEGDDAITITPGANEILLDKVRSEYLWDFSEEPPYEEILYAVWSDAVTVTFNVAYSSNMNANPLKLHIWSGPDTTDEPGAYGFYRSGETAPYVTYTVAKGERVPKPDNLLANSEMDSAIFIKWLLENNDTKSYRYNTKSLTDEKLTTYGFDFSQRVTENVMLISSWTTAVPHVYTFTVENTVEGGGNTLFNYTIEVSDELVFGKLGTSNSNGEGIPDRRWGSVSVSLESNRTYTVVATITKIPNWGGAYGVVIDVIDSNGTVVKTGQVIYCNKNTYKNYVSDYMFNLTIRQENKEGFVSSVAVDADSVINITEQINNVKGYAVNEEALSFAFHSAMSANNRTSFLPEINGYDVNNPNSSLTVVFTNRAVAVVAPTGYHESGIPYLWVLLLGLLLCGAAFVYCRRRAGTLE